MTRDELIELGRKLLVLAGMTMEDLSPDLVVVMEDELAIRINAEILRQGTENFAYWPSVPIFSVGLRSSAGMKGDGAGLPITIPVEWTA